MTGGKPLAGPRITVDRQKMAALVLVRGVYNSISPADILGNMVDSLSRAFSVSPKVYRRSGILFMVLGMIILILSIMPAITQGRVPVLWVPVAILGAGFYNFCRGFGLDASRRRALDLLPVLLGAAIIALAFLAPTQGREFPLVVGGAMMLLYGISWIVSLASGRADHGT